MTKTKLYNIHTNFEEMNRSNIIRESRKYETGVFIGFQDTPVYLNEVLCIGVAVENNKEKKDTPHIVNSIPKIQYSPKEIFRLNIFETARRCESRILENFLESIPEASNYINDFSCKDTPLHMAIKSENKLEDIVNTVKVLLNYGADPRILDKLGRKPAFYRKEHYILKKILEDAESNLFARTGYKR